MPSEGTGATVPADIATAPITRRVFTATGGGGRGVSDAARYHSRLSTGTRYQGGTSAAWYQKYCRSL